MGQPRHTRLHGHSLGHIAQHGHCARHMAMAVGNRAGRKFHIKPLVSGAMGNCTACRRQGTVVPHGSAQRALEISAHLRRNQANHFIHIAASRIKSLPAGEPLGHWVQVSDLPLRVAAHHGIANGLQGQAHQLFFFKEQVFHALALADVGGLDEQAQHLVAIALGGVRHDDVPPYALGIREPGFKHLRLALQGVGQQLFCLLEAFGPQQIAHVHSVQLFKRHAKPGLVGLVAKAVVEVHIP